MHLDIYKFLLENQKDTYLIICPWKWLSKLEIKSLDDAWSSHARSEIVIQSLVGPFKSLPELSLVLLESCIKLILIINVKPTFTIAGCMLFQSRHEFVVDLLSTL